MKGGDGSSSNLQEKIPDEEEQQTEDCLVSRSRTIYRFDTLFPPVDPMKTEKEEQTFNCLAWKQRIVFDRQFSRDIIFEIFYRTTFETLDSCTCVSKEWRDLITDKTFTDVYQKKHNINLYDEKEWSDFSTDHRSMYQKTNKDKFAGYFLEAREYLLQREQHCHYPIFVPLDEKNCDPSVRNWRIPEGKDILASSKQGIVICCDKDENYFVGLPAIGKWITMPKPDDFDLSVGGIVLGMVVLGLSPLWYKAVKLDWAGHKLYYQIFDSKLRKWRKPGVFNCVVRAMLLTHCPTICISEFIYFQTYSGEAIEFNGLNDSFSIIELPLYMPWCRYQIHEFNGRLGLVGGVGEDDDEDDFELVLWEMVEASNNTSTWCKRRVGHCKALQRRTKHNILYAKLQDEIITYRDCDFVFTECCRIFPFGL